ncbi:MAG TPA: hypothetical protein VGP96_00545 [Candidatus Dormibacteraeota bacterium]|nr:hypothetical protein [Candidatus Dormibacteraeota bacterium]
MGCRWRTLAGLLALGAALAAVDPAAAVAVPSALPVPTARVAAPTPAPAPRRPPAATPRRPTASQLPLPTPGDASAAGRRRLRAVNSVDEGFLLGLPGAGPPGPTAYVPPEPRTSTGDAASLLLAAMAGLLAAVGGGAVLLFVLVRPHRAPETPPARAGVALSPAQTRRGWTPGHRRRTARLPQEVFDRLPPLVQLALLDHAGRPAEPGQEAGAATPPAG